MDFTHVAVISAEVVVLPHALVVSCLDAKAHLKWAAITAGAVRGEF